MPPGSGLCRAPSKGKPEGPNSGGALLMTEAMGVVVEKVIPCEVIPVTGGYMMAEGMVVVPGWKDEKMVGIGAALVKVTSCGVAP